MSTDQKGAIAETAIALAAIRFGVDVYRPVVEGLRYDLLLDVGDRLLRVQCKWAACHDDVVIVRCYSCRRTRTGMLVRRYGAEEVDFIAVYCETLDHCYLMPPKLFVGRRQVHLRVGPSRNNQRRRINWADDFDLAARLESLGAVAQLGERLAGSQ